MQKHESGDGVKANYCWLIFLYVWSRRNAGMQHAFTRQTGVHQHSYDAARSSAVIQINTRLEFSCTHVS